MVTPVQRKLNLTQINSGGNVGQSGSSSALPVLVRDSCEFEANSGYTVNDTPPSATV